MSSGRHVAARAPVTRLITALLAGALLTASCSSDNPPEPGPSENPPAPVLRVGAAPVSGSLTEDDLVEALAAGGIATYAEASDDQPVTAPSEPGPMSVTGWQASTMQRQLVSGRGYVGRDLDALTLGAAGDVPFSVVLAAWVSAADTPAAGVARDLMGKRDWERQALDIVYPDAVLALFVNDIARDQAATGGTGATEPAVFLGARRDVRTARLPVAGGICSDMVSFLTGSLDAIVESLQIQVAEEGVLSVLASIWNTVVSIAASAAKIAIGAFTSALLAPVTRAITVVAVLSEAATLLDPWTIASTVAPADPLQPGTEAIVTAHVDAAMEFEWPADLKDCASTLAGVTLPDPGSAKGSPVQWTYEDPYGATVLGEQDEVVNGDGDALLHFATLPQDPGELDGTPVALPVHVGAHVDRTQIDKLTDLVDHLLLDGLPGPARAIVDALLGPARAAAREKLLELVSVTGPKLAVTTVRYEKTPPPGTEADCAVDTPTEVPNGVWKGPIEMTVVGEAMSAQTFSGGDGMLQLTVKKGKVTAGKWAVSWHSTGEGSQGGIKAEIDVKGAISGGVHGSAGDPVVEGGWSIHGSATVNVAGGTTLPLDFSGHDTEHMRIETTSCDAVTGNFIPSFNSKGSPATFTGKARWTGHRVSGP